MRILYIGSKADQAGSLRLEREVTELQRQFRDAAGDRIDFTFLPDVSAEELPLEIAKVKPDVLHISAHGSTSHLAFANESGAEVRLGAEALAAFLPYERKPRLIYLNSCDSYEIAEGLAKVVPMVLGSTAPITNRAARAGAVVFYSRILDGASVADAAEAARRAIETMQIDRASARLFTAENVDPAKQRLYQVPRVVAEVVRQPTARVDGTFVITVRIGLLDAPRDAVRIAFFTPDRSFEEGVDTCDADDNEGSICWSGEWVAGGDFRIIVAAGSPSALCFSGSVMLSEALRNLQLHAAHEATRRAEALARAIALLAGEGMRNGRHRTDAARD